MEKELSKLNIHDYKQKPLGQSQLICLSVKLSPPQTIFFNKPEKLQRAIVVSTANCA
jgi:hypothetical protein